MKNEMKLKPCLDSNSNQMIDSFKFDLERTGNKYAWEIKRQIPMLRLGVEKGGSRRLQQ